MPIGLTWQKSAAAAMSQVMSGVAPTWQRHIKQNNNRLIEALPSTSVQLLSNRESALRLPDPRAGASLTFRERQQQVVVRFAASDISESRISLNMPRS